mmetsp:Transcript_155070/g.497171  ORF Transcript_155070/g.497171 Transcript_155070/m.497171 type:complete len:636 (-) Transcript_155070:154-2061(-)
MDVQWRNVSVTVKRGKQILAPCSGQVQVGRMTALMGPSGSGKSTLLNCLREVITHQGEVRYNGARYCPELRQTIGFTEQDDVVIPQLTVRQSLRFLADLRFGINSKESLSRVDEVMAALRLVRIADSVIGDASASQRISGGERRRLCIARELLAEPRLLICDEPTSGLDSTMADQVVASMRELCNTGRVSVVASIHQPSTNIFNRFDDLILLREGHVLHCGPACEAEALFTSQGLPRNPSQSTSEFVMDLLVLSDGSPGTMSPEQCERLRALARERGAALKPLGPPVAAAMGTNPYSAPVSRQLAVLTVRHGYLLKGEVFTKVSTFQNIGLMLCAALLWVRLDLNSEQVRSRYGLCLWILGTWMFFPLFGSLGTFAAQRRVLEKELSVGCYSLGSFYLARTGLLLPLDLVWPTLWTFGVFWISNANPDFGRYVLAQLLVYFSFCVFQGLGLAVGASAISPQYASTMVMILVTYCFGWSGFFVDLTRLPVWLTWVAQCNPFMYATEILMLIILPDSLLLDCSGSTNEKCESIGGARVLTGREARVQLGITSDGPWVGLAVMLGVLVASRLLAFLFLRRDLWTAVHGAAKARPAADSVAKIAGPPAGAGLGEAVATRADEEQGMADKAPITDAKGTN